MSDRSPSIVWRILRLHFAALILAAVVIPVAANQLLTLDAQSLQRRALDGRAAELAHALNRQDGGWRLRLPPKQQASYEQGSSGYVFAIVDGRGGSLFAAPSASASTFRDTPRGDGPVYFSKSFGGSTYTALSQPASGGGGAAWIVVAQDLQNPDVIIDDVVGRFLLRTALLTTPLLVVLMSLDVIGLRRVFRPVLAASAIASDIRPGRQDQLLPVQNLPREVRPLAVSMNEALKRLQAGYAAQREFNANVAHELRTPLAVMRLQADQVQDEAARQVLLTTIAGMSRAVGQLLEMAQLETDLAEGGQTCDLHAVASAVTLDLALYGMQAGRELSLVSEGAPVMIKGDGDFIGLALRNLIENAIVHATAATQVEVTVTPDGGVCVEDDGAGLDPKHWPNAFDRFWRGPQSKGAGIGLSIASRIVGTFGGVLEVGASRLGGARFSARFVKVAGAA